MRDCHAQRVSTVESTDVCCPCLVFAFFSPVLFQLGASVMVPVMVLVMLFLMVAGGLSSDSLLKS